MFDENNNAPILSLQLLTVCKGVSDAIVSEPEAVFVDCGKSSSVTTSITSSGKSKDVSPKKFIKILKRKIGRG